MKPENLVACHECDLLFWRPPRLRALAAHCPRCRARVGGSAHGRPALDRRCAIALAALFTLFIAQAFPIVALDAAGIASHATLAGGCCVEKGRLEVCVQFCVKLDMSVQLYTRA